MECSMSPSIHHELKHFGLTSLPVFVSAWRSVSSLHRQPVEVRVQFFQFYMSSWQHFFFFSDNKYERIFLTGAEGLNTGAVNIVGDQDDEETAHFDACRRLCRANNFLYS